MAAPASFRPNAMVAAACACTVAAMVALTYASVPLYRLFCQATGYGGTTQRADAAPARSQTPAGQPPIPGNGNPAERA